MVVNLSGRGLKPGGELMTGVATGGEHSAWCKLGEDVNKSTPLLELEAG